MPTPLLSICIPTLNRAGLLEDMLHGLRPEVAPLADRVEVVVSDNASHDGTADVLRRHQDWITWGRAERTAGFTRNLLKVTCDLAKGHFVWLVGDDDLVIRGAVSRVLRSLEENPDLDYHYLNFGWVDVQARADIIRNRDSAPLRVPGARFQCDEMRTLRLERLEDLALLPGRNPSALFSGIFCFAARRELFLRARPQLHPSDSLDGSSVLADDCFPHAMITLPALAGRPVAYLGEPCLLQGINAWEWGRYAYKNMLFGTHQLFSWLEATPLAKDGLAALWASYFDMAGRLYARMLRFPEEHDGEALVRERVLPQVAMQVPFWEAFLEEDRMLVECDQDARGMVAALRGLGLPQGARVGLWGIQGRGHRFVFFLGQDRPQVVWAADREPTQHGRPLDGTEVSISSPETLRGAALDVLVLGVRRAFVPEVSAEARGCLRPGARILSVLGVETV
jgi:hypothetical protein